MENAKRKPAYLMPLDYPTLCQPIRSMGAWATLVIMGTKDPDFPDPIAEGQYLVEKTGGRLVLIEGAGHYPQTEMPEKTAPFVLDFLQQV